MSNKLKAITKTVPLDLDGTKISCTVLEDGTRILVDRSVATALGTKGGGAYWEAKRRGETNLPEYISNAYLKPFISEDLSLKLQNPIHYIDTNGNDAVGIDATLLTEICNVWITAKNAGVLKDKQGAISDKAYILLKAFATVGITSLIDEATGYQYERERFELQKILNAYIADKILEWQLTFTLDFYKEMFRLWNIDFTPENIRRKPQFIGKLTSKYVYDLLPEGVVNKIKEQTGKTKNGNYKYRWHQSLSPEIGREHLKKQIIEITTLMSISDTKEEFEKNFQKKYGNYQYTIDDLYDIEKLDKKEELSDFNKNLKTALNYSDKD